jgi:hypothetical protein
VETKASLDFYALQQWGSLHTDMLEGNGGTAETRGDGHLLQAIMMSWPPVSNSVAELGCSHGHGHGHGVFILATSSSAPRHESFRSSQREVLSHEVIIMHVHGLLQYPGLFSLVSESGSKSHCQKATHAHTLSSFQKMFGKAKIVVVNFIKKQKLKGKDAEHTVETKCISSDARPQKFTSHGVSMI